MSENSTIVLMLSVFVVPTLNKVLSYLILSYAEMEFIPRSMYVPESTTEQCSTHTTHQVSNPKLDQNEIREPDARSQGQENCREIGATFCVILPTRLNCLIDYIFVPG